MAVRVSGSGWASVVAIDPGGTSGWTVMSVHPDALDHDGFNVLDNVEWYEFGEFVGSEDRQVCEALELVDAWPDAAVVIEDFRLRQFRADDDLLSPVRVGQSLGWAVRVGARPTPLLNIEDEDEEIPAIAVPRRSVFMQGPSDALGTVTDDRLKRWGYYRSHSGPHARDATRHALYFYRQALAKPVLRKEAWPDLFS
jgi:hypothetical protein